MAKASTTRRLPETQSVDLCTYICNELSVILFCLPRKEVPCRTRHCDHADDCCKLERWAIVLSISYELVMKEPNDVEGGRCQERSN